MCRTDRTAAAAPLAVEPAQFEVPEPQDRRGIGGCGRGRVSHCNSWLGVGAISPDSPVAGRSQ
jgi:hypothetical protein